MVIMNTSLRRRSMEKMQPKNRGMLTQYDVDCLVSLTMYRGKHKLNMIADFFVRGVLVHDLARMYKCSIYTVTVCIEKINHIYDVVCHFRLKAWREYNKRN